MKEINAEIYLNGNNDGTTVKLSDREAEKLLALWKEAQDTILKDMEEEDYWALPILSVDERHGY